MRLEAMSWRLSREPLPWPAERTSDAPVSYTHLMKRKAYTPHSCRHTFATLMKRVQGADKDKLELIGHTSTDMLRHYQDVDYQDLRRITDAM